jgi:hypothetical protein
MRLVGSRQGRVLSARRVVEARAEHGHGRHVTQARLVARGVDGSVVGAGSTTKSRDTLAGVTVATVTAAAVAAFKSSYRGVGDVASYRVMPTTRGLGGTSVGSRVAGTWRWEARPPIELCRLLGSERATSRRSVRAVRLRIVSWRVEVEQLRLRRRGRAQGDVLLQTLRRGNHKWLNPALATRARRTQAQKRARSRSHVYSGWVMGRSWGSTRHLPSGCWSRSG